MRKRPFWQVPCAAQPVPKAPDPNALSLYLSLTHSLSVCLSAQPHARVYNRSVSKLGGFDEDAGEVGSKRTPKEEEKLTSDAEIEEVFQKLRQVAAKQGFSTWSPKLTTDLLGPELNKVEAITARLKGLGRDAAKGGAKVALWNELKAEAFAQCVAVVWGVSILNAFLSVQLMIVARISTLFETSSCSELMYHDVRMLLERELEKTVGRFLRVNLREICAIATESAREALDPIELSRITSLKDVLSTLACISSTTEFQISGKGWAHTLLSGTVEEEEGEQEGPEPREGERLLLEQFRLSLRKVLEGQDFEFAVSVSARCVSDILMAKCKRLLAMQLEHRGEANKTEQAVRSPEALPLAKFVPLVSTSSEEVVSECDLIIEHEVSKLPEVIRACADAFSIHVA